MKGYAQEVGTSILSKIDHRKSEEALPPPPVHIKILSREASEA
jgi:hypothetical protein